MAERRMFTKKITNSDAFIDMPLSTQALYFHLNMEADDDGFNSSPKKIQRMIGASDDDLKLLFAKNFVIPFDSGVVVIKHWKLHNYIQNDRYKETVYLEEKSLLDIKKNKAYTLMDTNCIQDVYRMDTQNSIDKNSIDNNISKSKKQFVPPTLEEVKKYVSDKQLKVNAEQFYNYFTEGNWIDSKGNKVKSWKQKILTWNGFTGTTQKEIKKSYQNYEQRDIKNFDNFYAN